MPLISPGKILGNTSITRITRFLAVSGKISFKMKKSTENTRKKVDALMAYSEFNRHTKVPNKMLNTIEFIDRNNENIQMQAFV